MSSVVRCARDGKMYPASETINVGSVPVAIINLTEEEKITLGLMEKPTMGEEENKQADETSAPASEGQADSAPQTEGQPAGENENQQASDEAGQA